MDSIRSIAERHRLIVIEDAAQALLSSYKGIAAGCLGTLGCFSFHESKNISSGEGGALTVTKPELVERAFIVWEKGTNRQAFQRGLVDHYRWVDVGSSFLPSEFMAAILYAQLENAELFTQERLSLWQRYHAGFADLEAAELARLPIVPRTCEHNGHLFYLLLRDRRSRDALIERLRKQGIQCCFHYVPLHSSPAGMRYGRTVAPLQVTDDASARLVRLPLHSTLSAAIQEEVIDRVSAGCRSIE
jgi:dTDP-4-amino-4,6-dideoxygalactose transaminase